MDKIFPKISVIIISYKQEELIKRAMDSLVEQKEYLYEICISDDCSPDRTYEVLLDYQRRFPNLVKPHRNDHNLGIFKNVETSWALPTGDIIYMMSGDDEAAKGYFKAAVDFLEMEKINWQNELFCLYGDYKQIYPDGKSFYCSNEMVERYSALSLAIRGLIGNRSTLLSMNVLRKYPHLVEKNSYSYECIQDRMLQIFSEKSYYIPVVGNIYYAGIGVSAHMTEDRQKDRLNMWPLFLEYCNKWNVPLSSKDTHYAYFRYYYQRYVLSGKFVDVAKSLMHYFFSIDLRYGTKGLKLDGMKRYVSRCFKSI